MASARHLSAWIASHVQNVSLYLFQFDNSFAAPVQSGLALPIGGGGVLVKQTVL